MKELMNGGNQVCSVNGNVSANGMSVNNLNKNKMIKINSVGEIKQVFDNANFTEFAIKLGMFENLKMYADKEVLKKLPNSFESNYIIDGKKQIIYIEYDNNNVIHLSIAESKMETIEMLLSNYVEISKMDEHTYMFKCATFGKYIGFSLQYLKQNEILINEINGIIDIIAEVPNEGDNELWKPANYIVITK